MSYRFGQFRKTQFQSYLTPLEYSLEDLQVQSNVSQSIIFVDKAIQLNENNILMGQDTNGNQCSYYLRFKVQKHLNDAQIINIKIVNTNKQKDNIRLLKTVTVAAGQENTYSTFELVISPNDNYTYNQIWFELNRELIDFNTQNSDGTYGRTMQITIERLDKIYNVINFLSPSLGGSKILKQIGVQGPPGLLMSINGEEIRIGRSGLYEINHGINTTFIGFIIEADEKYFILDYQY